MFDLRKIFGLRKTFAVPKDFLKSKIYCTNNMQGTYLHFFSFIFSMAYLLIYEKNKLFNFQINQNCPFRYYISECYENDVDGGQNLMIYSK